MLILPACLHMEMNGGIRHCLTFGFIGSNRVAESSDVEELSKTTSKKTAEIGSKILKFAVSNFMLWFGLLEFSLSFKVLVDFAMTR